MIVLGIYASLIFLVLEDVISVLLPRAMIVIRQIRAPSKRAPNVKKMPVLDA
jgi:hypothetical protein